MTVAGKFGGGLLLDGIQSSDEAETESSTGNRSERASRLSIPLLHLSCTALSKREYCCTVACKLAKLRKGNPEEVSQYLRLTLE